MRNINRILSQTKYGYQSLNLIKYSSFKNFGSYKFVINKAIIAIRGVAMKRFEIKPYNIRQSQKFLSKADQNSRSLAFCCFSEDDLKEQILNFPKTSVYPHPKISIKQIYKRKLHHNNSQNTLSKISIPSNISPKLIYHYNPKNSHSIIYRDQSQSLLPNNSISFVYHSPTTNYNRKRQLKTNPIILCPLPLQLEKRVSKVPAKVKQFDQNIQKEFLNILDFGDKGKDQYICGDPLPLETLTPPTSKVRNTPQIMPNFSFGQTQKQKFMSKYLNIKLQPAREIAISSKQSGELLMKYVPQEKQSKSSKSSGHLFVRGTFSQNANGFSKKTDMLMQYRSESDSSQSIVLESYQRAMKKKMGFI